MFAKHQFKFMVCKVMLKSKMYLRCRLNNSNKADCKTCGLNIGLSLPIKKGVHTAVSSAPLHSSALQLRPIGVHTPTLVAVVLLSAALLFHVVALLVAAWNIGHSFLCFLDLTQSVVARGSNMGKAAAPLVTGEFPVSVLVT